MSAHRHSQHRRRPGITGTLRGGLARPLGLVLALVLSLAAFTAPASAAPLVPLTRIDLVVLVVDDDGPAVAALTAELTGQGTPFRRVRLADPARPTIDAAFLSDTVDGRPRAKYQAVILSNENPFGAGSAEMAALAAFETSFGIRQTDASTTARPAVGLGQPAYTGSLAGLQAGVTAAGLAGPFGYLRGSVPFDADTPAAPAGSGQLANPLGTLPAGASFTTLVDAPVPGGGGRGSLVGEYAHDGRRELVLTFTYRQDHSQFRLLARGLVDWVTQGVHVGSAAHGVRLDRPSGGVVAVLPGRHRAGALGRGDADDLPGGVVAAALGETVGQHGGGGVAGEVVPVRRPGAMTIREVCRPSAS
ncbi:hypothetical protein [Kitasatospora purpeofusca]|uniref:hypothetical protein n=1 Tax=Kitasatospora purpeofusca TaxID=67352 RepID=UPI00386C4AB1